MKKNRGFTLIELIVVMAIIGILILLATPKFLNYIEQAKLTQIINDVKVAENMALVQYIKTGEIPEGFKEIKDEIILKDIKEGLAYNTKGKINSNLNYSSLKSNNSINLDTNYYRIPKSFVKGNIRSRLKGEFIINMDMEGIYMDKFIEEDEENIEDIDDNEIIENMKDSKFTWVFYEANSFYIKEGKFDEPDFEVIKDVHNYYKGPFNHKNNNYYSCNGGNSHSKTLFAMATGFKEELDPKNNKLDAVFPDKIICNCGNTHDVIGIGHVANNKDNFDNNSSFLNSFNNLNIGKLSIPKSIDIINGDAFMQSKIDKIIFRSYNSENNKIKVIGPNAFNQIIYNGNINLPINLRVISPFAFHEVNHGQANISHKICTINNFDSLNKLTFIGFKSFKRFNPTIGGELLFANNKLHIPDSVEYIGPSAFVDGHDMGNENERLFPYIKDFKLSKNPNLIMVKNETFEKLLDIKTLTIPSNIKYIGSQAFINLNKGANWDISDIDLEKTKNNLASIIIESSNLKFASNEDPTRHNPEIAYNFPRIFKDNGSKTGIYDRIEENGSFQWYYRVNTSSVKTKIGNPIDIKDI